MINIDMERPLCKSCQKRPAAVNYIRNERRYYRSLCEHCIKVNANPEKVFIPSWRKSGYKKKMKCDQCGFTAMDSRQMTVLHVDGDLRNNNWPNLKSVCSNCVIEISIKGLGWKSEDVTPDF